ncbi:MAG: Peptide methionine sulfoxide reductase MsrB [Chlamydiae bacterium]|nr:Peptide methionine sulfoxide reductase MsrB [Chlamydiota bacterium]
MERSDEEWKQQLTPEQYEVLRKKGTEKAFSGAYHDSKKKGTYRCAGCGNELFRSEDKFDSGTGWPSFTRPCEEDNVGYEKDYALLYKRMEVHCEKCGGHLGHVFDDGPEPTHKRFCLNSAALTFEETA